MKRKDLDIEAILAKVESLGDSYWRERFEAYDIDRAERNTKTKEIVDNILSDTLEDLYMYIYAFYGKYAEDGVVTSEIASINLDSQELLHLINVLNDLLGKAELSDIQFDKDVKANIEDLSTESSVTRLQGLILQLQSRIELAYGDVMNEVDSHMFNTVQNSYLQVIYEVFYAVGYGTKKMGALKPEEILLLLALAWRSSGEPYDDVLWRYKRETEALIGRDVFQRTWFGFPIEDTIELVEKLFGRDTKNIKTLIDTDSTYYSTQAEKKGFEDTEIEKALYCTIHDERRSEICAEADGNIIPVDEIEPWFNAPPLHYNCRSWLTPIIEQVDFLTGEIEEVADESYDGWYDKWL